MSAKPYTYVDRYKVGVGIIEIKAGNALLIVYPTSDIRDSVTVEIPASERSGLAAAIQTGDGAGAGQVADAAADEEPLGSGGETAPSSPKEAS